MITLFQRFFVGLILSLYFFPIGFTFLPASINTKMILAVIGLCLLAYDCVLKREVMLSRVLLGATAMATLFSLICLFAVDFNGTNDYSYASYLLTFCVWMAAAYAVCYVIRGIHKRLDIPLLTFYLAGVCLLQCILAILIDRVPELQVLVNRYVEQGQDFLLDINRLYGIGASLDNAGVRFGVVLILIAAVLSKSARVQYNKASVFFLVLAYFSIALIGNMISRTTSVGLFLSLAYLLLNTGLLTFVIQKKFYKFHLIFGGLLLLAVLVSIYLYQSDKNFYTDMRFAFEGFFNLVEKGEFRTSSTDKLNNVMWIWPQDLQTWIIGSGYFDNFYYSTDIGYCRFVLYCGLLGFVIFALFFVYNALVFAQIHKPYWDLFLLLLAYTFLVWIKVSTDIFFIYALFYCLDDPRTLVLPKTEPK